MIDCWPVFYHLSSTVPPIIYRSSFILRRSSFVIHHHPSPIVIHRHPLSSIAIHPYLTNIMNQNHQQISSILPQISSCPTYIMTLSSYHAFTLQDLFLGVSKNTATIRGYLKMDGKSYWNPIKMDDLGVPLFLEIPIICSSFHPFFVNQSPR